ncbi:MAG: hypothetical protein ACLRFJ_03640 [Alphaproteobacteria bacterium]
MSHTITLNGNIIEAIRKNIDYPSHERSKYARERLRFSHCLFLTQDKNILTYQTLTRYTNVLISEPTDIKIPYPLAINLEPVHIENSPSINLEIPDGTLAGLRAFNSDDRPRSMKTDFVMLGNYETNLEYLDDMQRWYTNYANDLMNCELDYAPTDDAQQYEWNTSRLCNLADTLHLEYTKPCYIEHPLSLKPEVDKYTISKILQQISKFGYLYRIFHDEDSAVKTISIPIAIFEKIINTQQMTALISGRGRIK